MDDVYKAAVSTEYAKCNMLYYFLDYVISKAYNDH